MTMHQLQGRTDDEILWFRRRGFLQAAAAWAATGATAAGAQQRGNIVELRGDVLANGRPVTAQGTVQSGDRIDTGPGSQLVCVIGSSAFLVRQNTSLVLERGSSINAVGLLRLLTGAVASVWGPGTPRGIVTPTLTAGIRGTGVYTEVFEQEDFRSYFCNCYGSVMLSAQGQDVASKAEYHQSFWAEPATRSGRAIRPAQALNHTDEELETLAWLAGQRTAWQIRGRKGVKDGYGAMEQQPPELHPARRP